MSDRLSNWLIYLLAPNGVRQLVIDAPWKLHLVLVVNSVGAFTLESNIPVEYLAPESRLVFYRSRQLAGVGLLRRCELSRTNTRLSGASLNTLLARRIVAYRAGTAQSAKGGAADDMAKAVVRENLGSLCTNAARDLSGKGLSVHPDLAKAPSIDKAFAYRNVATVLSEIAASSAALGTDLFYGIVPTGETTFEFRTWVGQPGRDLTEDLIFSDEFGNLNDPVLDLDYSRESTVVISGGQGEGSARLVAEAEDTSRTGAGPLGRIEKFADANQSETIAQVEDAACADLLNSRPRARFTGKIIDSDAARYGRDWNLGDRVRAIVAGQSFDCLIRTVEIDVNDKGDESISARLECDIPLSGSIAVTDWP